MKKIHRDCIYAAEYTWKCPDCGNQQYMEDIEDTIVCIDCGEVFKVDNSTTTN